MTMNLNMKSQLFAMPICVLLQSRKKGTQEWIQQYCGAIGAMKQQQSIPQKRFSSGSAELDAGEAAPPISELIAKSFLRSTHSKLVFSTQSISMIKPIALSYLEEFPKSHEPNNSQLLLIDFSQLEIDFLQEILKLTAVRQARRNYFEPDLAGALEIVRMNNQQIEKRKVLYMKPGILALSTQVFLTDLLRGWNQGSGLKIKIILKMSEKILTHYHYHAWLTTILKIKEQLKKEKENSLSIIYLCNSPNYYADENELVRIYRTFFCKKVVIWPFGRAEIHKALIGYRQGNALKEWEHTLSMSEGERRLHETLMQLYYFLKKRLASKFTQKPGGEHILYSNAMEEGYQFTKGELTEFEHVKLLLIHLQSSSKLTMLNLITKFIEMKDCEIWNSNNSQAITIIENILSQLEQSVFQYEKKEDTSNADLIRLFNKSESVEIQINYERQQDYACMYPIGLSLAVKPETNEKISQIVKIIQSIQPLKIEHAQQLRDESLDQASIRFSQQINRKVHHKQEDNHNVLIMCSLKGVERFIKESLEGYITEKSYLQYLRSLYRYLRSTRYFRLRKIKKIYDRRKVKIAEAGEASKKIGDRFAWTEENKQILKETLFHELEKLNSIIEKFEITLGGMNNVAEKGMNSQDTFQHNKDEVKLVEGFNEDILNAGFTIIDISQIKATYLCESLKNIVFETNNLKKKVIVDHENKGIEPNYFYQLVQNFNPSTIIFYAPSPLLLRSLYLYQIENTNQNLRQIHILSYQNSYETKKTAFEITKQDKAFWNISQNRSKLPEFIQSPFLRVRSINYRDSVELAKHRLNSKSLFRNEQGEGEKSIGEILNLDQMRRKVLVDTRQFKSSLPSHLYHFGFQVIPVFLKTSDYVLSDDTAIQKKSVHTRDLHNSLKNFRLEEQLKKMCSKFKHPYLLIECEQETDFVKSSFGYLDGTSGNRGRYELRKKLIQLLHKFPSVRVIWSSSVEQSCEFIRQLKEEKQDPDLSKFIKQQSEEYEEKGSMLPRVSEAASQKQEEDR